MPSIGFEWQFTATDLTFQEKSGNKWTLINDLPSKSLVFHWPNPGVKIESDSGEVEIITDPVQSWDALQKQLVLIGELLVALGMSPPDWGKLSDGNMQKVMARSGFGTGLGIGESTTAGGRTSTKRKASTVIKYPQQVVLDAGGHLQLQDIVANSIPPVVLNQDNNKKLVSFLLAAAVNGPVDVVNNVEQPAAVFRPADNRIAVFGMHTGGFNGVAQCTMERSLDEMPGLIEPFSPDAVQQAAQWLNGSGASADLTGFATMLWYYRAMFGRRTIKTIDDGPKAGFNLLPRMNVRSVYRVLLDNADRGSSTVWSPP